jgi:FAD/FMN-containing dehydrogenase
MNPFGPSEKNVTPTEIEKQTYQKRFKGRLIWREEPEYEEARSGRVFNARKPQRYPSAVLFVESLNDVVAAVQLAHECNLKISVRAGGHSWDGWSVRDGSLLIDFNLYREMSYDEHTGIASTTPSISGGELNPYLKPFGVFFPGGHCPEVGVGGFLLQGGQGWNARGLGWACENIEAIDMVTADGKMVHASATENADLFWAARGSGPGFFAIVVRFYLRTRPLPKALTRTSIIYPMELFDEVMSWLYGIHASISLNVETVALALTTPHAGPEYAGKHVLLVAGLAFADTPEEAHAALAPFESCPVLDRAVAKEICVPTTLAKEYEEQLRQNPKQQRYAADNLWLSRPASDVVPALKPCFQSLPTPQTFALWYSMAPLPPLSDMAFSLQSEAYVAVYTIWEKSEDDAHCRGWLKDHMQRMEPLSDGFYLGDSDIPTRSARFMADENYRKLEELRAVWDPEGRICSYRPHAEHTLNENPWETKNLMSKTYV